MFEFILIMDPSDRTVYDCFHSLCRNHGKFQWISIKKPLHFFWNSFFLGRNDNRYIWLWCSHSSVRDMAFIILRIWYRSHRLVLLFRKNHHRIEIFFKINPRLLFLSDMLVLQQTNPSSIHRCVWKIIFGNRSWWPKWWSELWLSCDTMAGNAFKWSRSGSDIYPINSRLGILYNWDLFAEISSWYFGCSNANKWHSIVHSAYCSIVFAVFCRTFQRLVDRT